MSKYTFYNCIFYAGMIMLLSILIYLAYINISLEFGILVFALAMVCYGLYKRSEQEVDVESLKDSINKAIFLLKRKKDTTLAWDGNLTEVEQILYKLKEMFDDNKDVEG